MKRSALVVAVLVVLGTLSAFPVSGMAPTATSESQPTAANNTSIAPGERLSGVVGVHEAELEGEIKERAFDIAFERADDNASKAEVIARESSNLSERLDELEERKADLQEARENGSMSEGEYRARVAKLAVELNNTRELAQEAENASEGLPEDVLEANGVNVTAIRTLQERAGELSGPEVAAIARSIAGNERGEVPEQARGDRGNGEDTPENASEAIARAEQQVQSARERIQQAEQRVNDTNASDNATEALERARAQLSNAEEALAMAHNASEDGDEERAMELAQQANEHAEDALESANDAIQAAEQQRDGRDGDQTPTATSGEDGSNQDGSDQTTPTEDGGY